MRRFTYRRTLQNKDYSLSETSFKTCFNCSKGWETTTEFLEDPEIDLLGYQINIEDLSTGLFLFGHTSCQNGLAIYVRDFNSLRNGAVFTENKSGRKGCPGHCLYNTNFEPCGNSCAYRWVRDVMQVIKGWKKQPCNPQTMERKWLLLNHRGHW